MKSSESTAGWQKSWTKKQRSVIAGGQGDSFVATSKADPTVDVFIKTLRRPKFEKARKRFYVEVASYETVSGLGLPRLIEHNAGEWVDKNIPLYMVLELIDGSTLGQYVKANGSLSFDDATACILGIASVVERCHADEVVHRDLKPDNIMLRGDHVDDPVVIDFGLSFNTSSSIGDITHVDEEIGNRFLRLPEFARGGRSPISDITHIAGLLLYALTGKEPRVLVDENDQPPHGQPPIASQLAIVLQGRALLRLQSLFDRAFMANQLHRFQSVAELRKALLGVTAPDLADSQLDDVMGLVREVVSRPSQATRTSQHALLNTYVSGTMHVINLMADNEGLSVSQTGYAHDMAATFPYGETQLALGLPGGAAPRFTVFRFELRDTGEVVFLADGVEQTPLLPGMVEHEALPVGLTEQAGDTATAQLAADDGAAPSNWRTSNAQRDRARRTFLAGGSIADATRAAGIGWTTAHDLLQPDVRASGRQLVTWHSMTDEQVLEAAALRGQGWTDVQLGERYGVSRQTVARRLHRGSRGPKSPA